MTKPGKDYSLILPDRFCDADDTSLFIFDAGVFRIYSFRTDGRLCDPTGLGWLREWLRRLLYKPTAMEEDFVKFLKRHRGLDPRLSAVRDEYGHVIGYMVAVYRYSGAPTWLWTHVHSLITLALTDVCGFNGTDCTVTYKSFLDAPVTDDPGD